MSKWHGVALALVFASFRLEAQEVPTIFTPDSEMNRAIAGKPLSEISVIRYGVVDSALMLDPVLPPHWTWIAGRGIRGEKGSIEFFFHNGIFFTNSREPTIISFRARRYPDLFTDRIQANVFVIGFEKEDEGVIFAATEAPRDVELVVDRSVFDKEITLKFRLGPNEGRLIRILGSYPPYLP